MHVQIGKNRWVQKSKFAPLVKGERSTNLYEHDGIQPESLKEVAHAHQEHLVAVLRLLRHDVRQQRPRLGLPARGIRTPPSAATSAVASGTYTSAACHAAFFITRCSRWRSQPLATRSAAALTMALGQCLARRQGPQPLAIRTQVRPCPHGATYR